MEEFNEFENVMNDIEIIKEIKKLEEANNKLGENNSNETRQYENSEEGELLQELDETRDVEKRQKLIEKIKDLRQPKLDGLYMKLNDKILVVLNNNDFYPQEVTEQNGEYYVEINCGTPAGCTG